MQHDGIQEECSDEEHEKSVVKNMSQNSDIKPERKSIQGRAERQKALADGTLCTGSLQRLTNMLMTMQNESEKMAEELEQAQKSSVIGPAVITNCTTVKTKLDAALAELQTYKDNNKEVETATVLKTAKQQRGVVMGTAKGNAVKSPRPMEAASQDPTTGRREPLS